MIFLKILCKNFFKSLLDYILYMYTFTILTVLIVVSNIFGEIVNGLHIEMIGNSLPFFIVVIAFFLASTINNYMVDERRTELANYMLAGMSKYKVIVLYNLQLLLLSIFAFAVGCVLGIIVGTTLIRPYFESYSLVCGEIQLVHSASKAIIYFILLQSGIIIINCNKLRHLSINKLLKEKVMKEEYTNDNFRKINYTFFLISVVMLGVNVILKNIHFIASTFFISLSIFFITSYTIILQMLKKCRKVQNWLLLKNIVIFDNVMLCLKSFKWFSVIMSFCVVVYFMTYMAGSIFLTTKSVLLSHELDKIMGVVQIILSILFLMVIFVLISVKQFTVLKDCRRKYSLLRKLGNSRYEQKRSLLLEIVVNYTFPIAVGILIILLLTSAFNSYLEELLKRSIIVFSIQALSILFLLYISYIALLYVQYYKKLSYDI